MGWLRNWRRKRLLAHHRIDEALWRSVTRQPMPFLRGLQREETQRLRAFALLLLVEKQFSGARGLELDQAMRLAIAVQACLPVLQLGLDRYDDWSEIVVMPIPPRQKPSKLPEILSHRELERLFAAAHLPKHRVLLMTTYAAGLRLSEVIALKLTDLDSQRQMIRVEQGKGRKDRYTIPSPKLLEELRLYWKMCRPISYLFPGRDPNRPMDSSAAQKIYYAAKERAGIQKGLGIHTLRHCFATHLLEAGVDLPTIQMLMGHTSILTTMRYLQVRRQHLDAHASQFDLLRLPDKLPKR